MSLYIVLMLRPSWISNCSSPVSFSSEPVYFASWSPMPVETPAEIFVAQIFAMPLRNVADSRLDTVMPTNGRKIR